LLGVNANGIDEALYRKNGRTKMSMQPGELRVLLQIGALLEIATQLEKIRTLLEEMNERDKGKR